MTRLGSLTAAAGYYDRELTLRGLGEARMILGEARMIRVAYVTADFFNVLGSSVEAGRTERSRTCGPHCCCCWQPARLS